MRLNYVWRYQPTKLLLECCVCLVGEDWKRLSDWSTWFKFYRAACIHTKKERVIAVEDKYTLKYYMIANWASIVWLTLLPGTKGASWLLPEAFCFLPEYSVSMTSLFRGIMSVCKMLGWQNEANQGLWSMRRCPSERNTKEGYDLSHWSIILKTYAYAMIWQRNSSSLFLSKRQVKKLHWYKILEAVKSGKAQ
jgi:hypothetical protein